jgi:hypothetical protein
MVTLTSLPTVFPVYNNNLILNASHSASTSNHYYEFKIIFDGVQTDVFNYYADPRTFDATINLSTVLSTYFESQVYQPSGITMFERIAKSVIPYHVEVKLYNSGNTLVDSAVMNATYVFNGCSNAEEQLDMQDFIMSGATSGYFLTNWHTQKTITLDDYNYISVLTGKYGSGYNSGFGGVRITRHQYDGSSAVITKSYSDDTKAIVNIDISPKSINVWDMDFINSDTEYYEVQEIQGYSKQVMRIDINQEFKIKKFYNFIYVNRMGGLDCFTATKVSNDEYKVKKEKLEQFVTQKTYYTDSQRTTNIQTQYLSAYQADRLKELFTSSAVKLWFNGKMNDITITNSFTVPDRYPHDKFIQIPIEFQYNSKNFSQQF